MLVPSMRGGSRERMAETGGSELARPALIAPASPGAAWRRRGIALDRYFTRVAILPTFVVMLGVFGMPLAFSFYLSFTGYAQGQGLFSGGYVGLENYQDLLSDPLHWQHRDHPRLHGGRCGSGNGTRPWYRVAAEHGPAGDPHLPHRADHTNDGHSHRWRAVLEVTARSEPWRDQRLDRSAYRLARQARHCAGRDLDRRGLAEDALRDADSARGPAFAARRADGGRRDRRRPSLARWRGYH